MQAILTATWESLSSNPKISVSNRPIGESIGDFRRESPIFSLFGDEVESRHFVDCEILVVFTSSPYELLSKLSLSQIPDELRGNLFITHGWGALVAVTQDETERVLVSEISREYSFGFETWKVENSFVVNQTYTCTAPIPQRTSVPKTDRAPIQKFDDSEGVLLKDIYLTIDQIESRSKILGGRFGQTMYTTRRLVNEIAIQILFLEKKITETEFADMSRVLSVIEADDEIRALTEYLEACANKGGSHTVKQLQSFRDILVQLRACLKYYYRQGFTCLPPVLRNDHPSGTYSLFGIGACLGGLQRLFDRIQSAVAEMPTFELVRQILTKSVYQVPWSLTIETNPDAYTKWIATIDNLKTKIHNEVHPIASISHYQKQLSYFSSRFGFKATDIAITASSESIAFCDRPSWHLSTLLHEYTHRFVSTVIAQLLEEDELDYELLSNYHAQIGSPTAKEILLTPFQLLKLLYWRVSINLREIDKQSYNSTSVDSKRLESLETIAEAVRQTQRDSEEIMVQVLEYCYFYQNSPEIYVKSIWSSWLALPSTQVRKVQYLLRTIIAISVEIKGRKEHRFERALEIVKRSLEALKAMNVVRNGAVDEIITYLHGSYIQRIKSYFFLLLEFADVSAHLLVNPKLRAILFTERSEVPGGEEWSYDLEACIYGGDLVDSPVNFIISQLRDVISTAATKDELLESERRSLWIFHVISAAGSP